MRLRPSQDKKSFVSVDPYTCLVSGMQGLALAGPQGYNGGPPPGTQIIQGPLGYQMVVGPSFLGSGHGPGPTSLPPMDHPPAPSTLSPAEESHGVPERGQSN